MQRMTESLGDGERWRSSLRKELLRIAGAVDVVALRAAIECLVA